MSRKTGGGRSMKQASSSRGTGARPPTGFSLHVIQHVRGGSAMRDWQRLVEVLFDALSEHVAQAGRPTWAYVCSDPGSGDEGSFALGLSEEPDAPDALLGRLAPPEWDAVGVIASGRTIPIPAPAPASQPDGRIALVPAPIPAPIPARAQAPDSRPGGRDAAAPRRATVRMACIITREDGAYCKAVTSDGLVLKDPPASGRMLDDLRRCLGFPEASPGACSWPWTDATAKST